MTIHFICRGNTYRSRLAETYLNSLQLDNIQALSSGIEASLNLSGIIGWYTQRIIQKHNLVNFEKPTWNLTTKEILEKSDFVVFMNDDIYDYCVNNLNFSSEKYETWKIIDTGPYDPRWANATEMEKIEITENTFKEIKKKVDELIVRLG